jgi:flagellar biosynthesis protein FlhF
MTVQTLTADSIQAALAEARRQYGDEVVLLESAPARDGRPARVTVLLDGAAPRPQPAFAEVAPLGFGYAGGRAAHLPAGEGPSVPREATPSAPAHRPLFTPPPEPGPSTADVEASVEAAVGRALAVTAARLEALERALLASGPLTAVIQRWAAHPLFARLIASGMRPETASALFAEVADRGLRPDDPRPEQQEAMAWALAQVIRDRLADTAPVRLGGAMMVVGPSGAGKTSLLMKLALHPSFYGRRRTGVLVVGNGEEPLWHDPVALYRRFGLAVQTVNTPADVEAALARSQGFDQILVDTPPLPRREAAAHAMLGRIRKLLAPLVPLDVVLALDATRSPDALSSAWLDRLPLPPRAIALTHLDEVAGWGRLADWLLTLARPVQLVASGPAVPDDAHPYAPSWFAEELARRLGAPVDA